MYSLRPGESVAMEGTCLYDAQVQCRIRIVRSPVRYGSADYEDPEDIASDLTQETFYIQYGSTTEFNHFNAGGGGYPTLGEAMAAARSAPGIGPTVQWK
jgi:hypothetical protein